MASGAPQAASFDTKLSVPGREQLNQTGIAVRVTPLRAALAPSSAPAPSLPAAGDDGSVSARVDRDGASHDATRSDGWSTPMTPETLGGDAGLTVIGFWEPGRSFNPLGALHLLAGERGPCARVVADATDPGAAALHDEMCQKMKTAVVQLPGGRREMHLCAIPVDAPGADLEPDADAETANAMRSLAKHRAAEGRVRDAAFLCFETRAMAPFHHAPLLLDKQLVVIFDLDETLLQAFTMNSLERRAESIRRAHDAVEAGAADQSTSANDAGQDGSGTAGGAGASGAGGGAGPDARVAPGALGANAAALTARDAKEKRRLREEDMSRLNQDRAMLTQFISENAVVDRRTGTRHEAKMEACATAPGEHTFRPVIRLPSPHVRGGSIVFTRIDPANRGTSMIIHTRPGWNELYAYLSGSDRAGRGDTPPTPRCSAYVCTMSEAAYAQEMWRLLDPRGLLIPQRDLQSRVVSVKQGEELKTIARTTRGARMSRELCVILDDRTSVWTENEREHILAVAPFMPYATDTGPGLKGEAPGEAGVLGAARRMIDAARMDVFMTFDKFAKFHAAFPNLPFEAPPNAGARSRQKTGAEEDADASDGEGKSSSGDEKADASNPSRASKSTRPAMPDAGAVLPQLMEKNAKQASNAITQMGGATRSAAGAGSRLQAMLGGIAAPRSNAATARPIGARPTVVASEEDRERERRDAAKREELTERAKLQNDRDRAKEEKEKRERAKEEAAAALKIASEAAAARRRAAEAAAEAKARANAPADADEENDMGLDSDEEKERKEAAYAEAGLGESSDDDDDDRVAAADISESDDDSDSDSKGGERALADDARAAATRPGETSAADTPKAVAGKESAPGARGKTDEGRGQGQGKKRLCTQCLARNVPREEIDHGRFCKSCPFHPDHEGGRGGGEKRKSAAVKASVDPRSDDDVPCMKCGDPSPWVDGAPAFVLCSNEDAGDGTPCQMGGHYRCLGLKRMPGKDDDWFCSEACLRAFEQRQKTPPSSPGKGKAAEGKGKAPASEKSPRSFWKAAAEEAGAGEARGGGKKRKAEEERVDESQPAKPATSPAKPPEKKFKSAKEQRANMLKKLSGKARK